MFVQQIKEMCFNLKTVSYVKKIEKYQWQLKKSPPGQQPRETDQRNSTTGQPDIMQTKDGTGALRAQPRTNQAPFVETKATKAG